MSTQPTFRPCPSCGEIENVTVETLVHCGSCDESFAQTDGDETRAVLRKMRDERYAALKAYAEVWLLLNDITTEKRGMTDGEAGWFYTGQPSIVWDALQEHGLDPTKPNREPKPELSPETLYRIRGVVDHQLSLGPLELIGLLREVLPFVESKS
jgi:hypothetical protein